MIRRRIVITPPLGNDELLRWTTDDERAAAAEFGPARRSEYLSWRAVVRRELLGTAAGEEAAAQAEGAAEAEEPGGTATTKQAGSIAQGMGNAATTAAAAHVKNLEITYDAVGAPVLPGRPERIAVSHCRGWIAVAISDRRCTVDIETPDRRFARLAPRYLTPAEEVLAGHPQWLAAAWCAKEALYKYAGRRVLALRDDLRIERADLAAGRIMGRILNGEAVTLQLRIEEPYVVVYAL